MYYNKYGTAFLVLVYLLIPIFYLSKQTINQYTDKINPFYNALRRKNFFIIVLFVSFSMTLFSLAGSMYPAFVEKNADHPFIAMLLTIESAGYAALFLALPIFIISGILDKAIKKLSGFLHLSSGLLDPITDEENISLRYKTFFELIKNVEEAQIIETAKKIGNEYGTLIVKRYPRLDDFKDFIDKWLETDRKAGFFEDIKLVGSGASKTLEIENSFAKKLFKDHSISVDNKKVCLFMENYVGAILNAYYEVHGKNVNLDSFSLNDKDCETCTNHFNCIIKLETHSS